jgi:hypothetical protein
LNEFIIHPVKEADEVLKLALVADSPKEIFNGEEEEYMFIKGDKGYNPKTLKGREGRSLKWKKKKRLFNVIVANPVPILGITLAFSVLEVSLFKNAYAVYFHWFCKWFV